MRKLSIIIGSGLCLGVAQAALSAEDVWLQCDGTVTTTTAGRAAPDKQETQTGDVYVYNDDTQRLYRYSPVRKRLEPYFVSEYTPSQIKWSSPPNSQSTYGAFSWEGALDRKSSTLNLVRRENGITKKWVQTCKPIQPLETPGTAPPLKGKE